MRVYLLKQRDFDNLLARIDRDPMWGQEGGSSIAMGEEERRLHGNAHRFFNYQIRTWIADVQERAGWYYRRLLPTRQVVRGPYKTFAAAVKAAPRRKA